MNVLDVKDLTSLLGVRVVLTADWMGVKQGTEGIVDQYTKSMTHEGIMVAWDLPDRPLPPGYRTFDWKEASYKGIIRDGFGRGQNLDETRHLEIFDKERTAQKKITEIWAFICLNPDGVESILAMRFKDAMIPLITEEVEKVPAMRGTAEELAEKLKVSVKLVRFSDRQEAIEIPGLSRPGNPT